MLPSRPLRLYSLALLLGIPVTVGWAAETSSQGKLPPQQAKSEVETLREEVQGLQEQLQEMRREFAMVNQGTAGLGGGDSGLFVPVALSIETPDHRAVEGFRVRMQSVANSAPHTEATGVTTGVRPLTWQLPRGGYGLEIMSPNGAWTARRQLDVNSGKSMAVSLIAPDPAGVAALSVKSEVDWTQQADVHFGRLIQTSSSMASSGAAGASGESPAAGSANGAGQGEESDVQEVLPTKDNGIDQIGMLIAVSTTIAVPQADNTTLEWQWSNTKVNHILLTNSDAYLVAGADSGAVAVSSGSEFYTASQSGQPEGQGSQQQGQGASSANGPRAAIGYRMLQLQRIDTPEHAVPVAPGEVTVEVEQIYGLASEELAESLGVRQGQSGEPQLWLQGAESRDQLSQDFPSQTVTLKPNEQGEVRIVSQQ